jgi:tetraacyldisaccharide 4'-kinase
MKSGWPSFWFKGKIPPWWAKAVSVVYCAVVDVKRWCYGQGIYKTHHLSVPVLIVGNRVVGGTGKTPVMMGLVALCQQKGLKVGIISRGYGRQDKQVRLVDASSTSTLVGDEPLLLWQILGVPVAVGAQRVVAAQLLLAQHKVDLLLSDDGWQHWALGREAVVEVVDAQRGYGNGYCLPAGPLRERSDAQPLANVVLHNGVDFKLQPLHWRHVATQAILPLNALTGKVRAMAGIGHPQRFFDTVTQIGLDFQDKVPLADHQHLSIADFSWDDGQYPLVMTAKDAVRCQGFARDHWWSLDVATEFTSECQLSLTQLVQSLCKKETNRG